MATTTSQTLAQTYQHMTDKESVLNKGTCDTYIGSIELTETPMYLLNADSTAMESRATTYIPALYKIFDEIIVNARDHYVKMQLTNGEHKVTLIDISVSDDGTITVMNDGNGIDIAKHPEHDIWIPEAIFGHLRWSTHYNNREDTIYGGKMGFGAKLTFIWSTYAQIETIDHTRGLKYTQEFHNNLSTISSPKITKCVKKPYVKITFKPDYARFGCDPLFMRDMFKRRVYDMAAVTDKSVKVKYNGEMLPVRTFLQYIKLYSSEIVHEECNEHWEYAVMQSNSGKFSQISFVNGCCTYSGGTHVNYIKNLIVNGLIDYIEKKRKITISPKTVENCLTLFLRCNVVAPLFDSQTKINLTTPMSKFETEKFKTLPRDEKGKVVIVTDKFIEKVAKLGTIVEDVCRFTVTKEETKIKRETNGSKRSTVNVPKLEDAEWAGTAKSMECTLLLCEGDSAKAGLLSGMSPEDRNAIGILPLRGKLLNVRGESAAKIYDKNEKNVINHIVTALGLEIGKNYTIENLKARLRYGRVRFVCDQDVDGTHIEGLNINLFDCEWQSLTKIDGFLGFMNTPIVKATKGTQVIEFYNLTEYETWKTAANAKTYTIKYYKGLGTSTKAEFQQYMRNKKMVGFRHSGDECSNTIKLAFDKKCADERKEMLTHYDRNNYLNIADSTITYAEFFKKAYPHFAKYSCDRAIPSVMDGLKPSQRKILFAAFKRNLTSEIKVSQLSGYVSEHAAYHHGEESLNKTIIGMAQTFLGSNNINLLAPNGQFGTRLMGGDDAGAPRYIYTKLMNITRILYNANDDALLQYLDDDGTPIEPVYYAPILPMVAVNGAKGLGVGYSTNILCYNPKEIAAYVRAKLTGTQECALARTQVDAKFTPFYRGFKGTTIELSPTRFMFKGNYTILGNTVTITELPIGTWTSNYMEFLATLKQEGKISDVKQNNTDNTVSIRVIFPDEVQLQTLSTTASKSEHVTELEKLLNLTTTETTTNMNAFDANEHLRKYESVTDLIDDYFPTRLHLYHKRKEMMVADLEQKCIKISNRAKFIDEMVNGTLDLRRKTDAAITEMLMAKTYAKIDNSFHYLTEMPVSSMSVEKVAALQKQCADILSELTTIRGTTPEQMWLADLEQFDVTYEDYLKELEKADSGIREEPAALKTNKKTVVARKAPPKKIA